jgi:hypothetical protein
VLNLPTSVLPATYELTNLPSPLVVENASKEQFEKELQGIARPIVFRGLFAKHTVLNSMASPAQAADFLQSKLLDKHAKMALTRIPFSEKSRMFYDEQVKAMNFGVANLAAQQCFTRMTDASRDADYAVQCVPVEQYMPALLPLLDNPLVSEDVKRFIWFGNKVVVAPHFDESDNLAVVLSGKRRFTLFPPTQTKHLYIGPLEFTPAGQPISMVNILNPDLNQHPHYKTAYEHALSVELEAGDAIYIPTPWWHHVQSLSDFNVLVNYWWNPSPLATAKPLSAILHAMQAFKHLPPAQRNDFKALLDYYVFDDAERAAEHLPEHAKGLLGDLSPAHKQGLEQWIRSLL